MSRIGILTSGGDCSGLNSVIRAAFIRGQILGYELLGFKRGVRGIASETPEYITFNREICDESLLTRSGSLIYSDTKWMKNAIDTGLTVEDIKSRIYTSYKELGLSGLICIGGDGSLHLLDELLIGNPDINLIAIPKTIDNDVNHTDVSVGFQTVIETVSEMIENIRSTAKSHERTMVVEVMGRGAGFIAMYSGIASGADVILVPEFRYNTQTLINTVKNCRERKDHCIIVVAESVETDGFKHRENFVDGIVKYSHLEYRGIGSHIKDILKSAGIDTRSVTLGHTQRGGKTAIQDRLLGTMFGIEAVNLIHNNNCGKLLCLEGGKIKALDINEARKNITRSLSKDDPCVIAAKNLGVYIGEI